MDSLISFLSNPVLYKVVFGYWVFNAAVDSLPDPEAKSNKVYQFIYRFLHKMSGNLRRAAKKWDVPGAEETAAQ